MTFVYFDGRIADFEDDEVITSTIGSISFGKFNTRSGIKTNSYKLPFTTRNKSIFENAEVINNGSVKPYRYFDIIIVVDGLNVFSGFASITKSQEYYECTAFSGMSDFYNKIKESYLRDLDLSEFNHIYNHASVTGSWDNTKGYVYAYCEYGKYSTTTYDSFSDRYAVPIEYLKPHTFLKSLVTSIFNGAGYSVNGKVFNDPRFTSHLLLYNLYPYNIVPGDSVILSQTLPDKVKQSTILLDFLNMYGLMLSVDNEDKVITAEFIDDIIFNKQIDWSDKIDDSELPEISYSMDGYGQVNTMSFESDDDMIYNLESDIEIDNETLELTGEVYNSPYFIFNISTDSSFADGLYKGLGTGTFKIKAGKIFLGNWISTGYVPGYGYIVFYNGKLYKQKTTSLNQNPELDTEQVYWEEYTISDETLKTRYAKRQRIVVLCISLNDCYERLLKEAFCDIEGNPCQGICDNKKFASASKYLMVRKAMCISEGIGDWTSVAKQVNLLKSICCCGGDC